MEDFLAAAHTEFDVGAVDPVEVLLRVCVGAITVFVDKLLLVVGYPVGRCYWCGVVLGEPPTTSCGGVMVLLFKILFAFTGVAAVDGVITFQGEDLVLRE